jgi:hypothetical protein
MVTRRFESCVMPEPDVTSLEGEPHPGTVDRPRQSCRDECVSRPLCDTLKRPPVVNAEGPLCLQRAT